jgi:Na+-transporting methylmalonyl-CoA/oxaloacetate decarboxylase gamma subunit
MSENIYLLTLCLPLATLLLIFFMRYVSAVLQARVRKASDDNYRQLAQTAATAQADAAAALAAISANVADLKTRLASVEKMLKEVD